MNTGDRPNWAGFGAMVEDLRKSLGNVNDVQKRMLRVTGTAWSDDRMVKVVVGPRGHLIELEIDPRIYRKPNSKALSATILATTREAIGEVLRQNKEILEESIPNDLRLLGETGFNRYTYQHDADVIAGLEEDDDE